MKKLNWLLIFLALMAISPLILAGCGVSQDDYNAVVTERDSLLAERTSLQTQLTSLQTEKETLQTNLNSATANLTDLQAKQTSLQKQIDDLDAQLADIKRVYPPRDFESVTELQNWLILNNISEETPATTAEEWISKALQIQADGLTDGFIINMDYDYDTTNELYTVYCTTIIDGLLYFWDPETDDVQQDVTLTNVR